MAQPVWLTDQGSLGTVEEGKFFQLPLLAYDPDVPDDNSGLFFTLLSGSLPDGIQVGPTGLISGIPKALASVQGVPLEVGENITSKFSVRAYTKKDNGSVDRLNDRTFYLTVTGQDIPEFITPPGQIGYYFDGDFVNYQIEFTDTDINDDVVASISSGSLPNGLTLTPDGQIIGYISAVDTLGEGAYSGFDAEYSGTKVPYDKYPFDFGSTIISKNYQFSVKITDGKEFRVRTFSIFVYGRLGLTADSVEYTADNSHITVDSVGSRSPYITNYELDLGVYKHDNFYMHQFDSYDPDGDTVQMVVSAGDLPPGLSLDPDTGWLFGYIGNIGFQDLTYSFTVRIFKVSDPGVYREYTYSIKILGNTDISVIWSTPENLGTIINGQTSTLYVLAEHTQNISLQYRLKSGSNSKLPQGLRLLPNGLIAGRCSYKTFALDAGETTFDKNIRTRLEVNETTFDMEFEFTVEAYNSDEIVNVEKVFKIVVKRQYNKPCQCLRIEAFLNNSNKDLIKSLLQNQDIFKPEWIYRAEDPWYGVRQKVWYEHAYGMEPATFQSYVDAVARNHYRKRLILGELKTARALDSDGNVLYEVIYSDIIDDQVNNNNESVASSIKLKYPVNADDSTEIDTVYPNSLQNMRNTVINSVGQYAPMLPLWMLSKQEDGSILGFTKAWVIAFTIPGKSKQIAYKINNTLTTQLNVIDFEADRYVLGWYSAKLWDSENSSWYESKLTTFDRSAGGATTETVFDGGSTRFIFNIDVYEYTDVYDKYVIFPQRRIIENGE